MYTQYYTIFNIHIPAIKGYNNIIHNFEQYIVFVLFCENDQKWWNFITKSATLKLSKYLEVIIGFGYALNKYCRIKIWL